MATHIKEVTENHFINYTSSIGLPGNALNIHDMLFALQMIIFKAPEMTFINDFLFFHCKIQQSLAYIPKSLRDDWNLLGSTQSYMYHLLPSFPIHTYIYLWYGLIKKLASKTLATNNIAEQAETYRSK